MCCWYAFVNMCVCVSSVFVYVCVSVSIVFILVFYGRHYAWATIDLYKQNLKKYEKHSTAISVCTGMVFLLDPGMIFKYITRTILKFLICQLYGLTNVSHGGSTVHHCSSQYSA